MHLEARTSCARKKSDYVKTNFEIYIFIYHLPLYSCSLRCTVEGLAPNRNALSSPSELSAACSSLNERKTTRTKLSSVRVKKSQEEFYQSIHSFSGKWHHNESGGGVGRVVWRILRRVDFASRAFAASIPGD